MEFIQSLHNHGMQTTQEWAGTPHASSPTWKKSWCGEAPGGISWRLPRVSWSSPGITPRGRGDFSAGEISPLLLGVGTWGVT